MRVLLTAIRGSGHVRPLLTYAKALTDQGHEVRLATPADAAGALAEAGVHHVVTARASDAEQAAFWAGLGKITNDEMLAIAIPERFVWSSARLALPGILSEIENWRPDLLLRDSAEFASVIAAEIHGLPSAVVEVHNGPTEVLLHRLAAPRLDDLRAEAGLVRDDGAALFRQPGFTAFPAAMDAEPGARPKARSGSGFVRHLPWLPMRRIRRPGAGCKGGPSSTPPSARSRTARASPSTGPRSTALAGLDVEALLTTGPHLDPDALGPVPDNVTVAAFVPQAEVLGEAAAVLCHGGSGTLLGVLAAGLPLVVAPLFADQPDNAAVTAALGCGLVAAATDAGAMNAALAQVLSEARFGESSRTVAAEIAALPDMDAAVAALEAMV